MSTSKIPRLIRSSVAPTIDTIAFVTGFVGILCLTIYYLFGSRELLFAAIAGEISMLCLLLIGESPTIYAKDGL